MEFLEFFTPVLVFIFVLVLSAVLLKNKRPKNFPRGPFSLPIIGNFHQFGPEPYKTFMKMSEKYGSIFALDFASIRGIVLNDPKSIKEALNNDAFSGRPQLRPFIERTGGVSRGVILSDGATWVEQRRFISKTLKDFGFGKRAAEALILDEVIELIESLRAESGQPIVTKHRFNAAVLNSLWHIITGERFSQNDEALAHLVKLMTIALGESNAAGAFMFFPLLTKLVPEMSGYNRFIRIFEPICDLVRKSMEEHKATFQPGELRDFTDVYWQEILRTTDPKSSFYDKEGDFNLMYGIMDLFIAGAETTSTTLNWEFLILALNPDKQELLHAEIKSVIGYSRLPSLTDRDSMPYTEAVIMEVMRLSAMVPLSVFHSTTQDTKFMGYDIPKGTLVVPNLYAALRDEKVWGDPDVFRPERFMEANGALNRHHEALIPFSTGKRVCLGETLARDELFLFTTSLFQRFQVSTIPGQPKPSLNDCHPGMVLVPHEHKLILTERF